VFSDFEAEVRAAYTVRQAAESVPDPPTTT
jgi:hypothetical protein